MLYGLLVLMFGANCIRGEAIVVSRPFQASTTSALDSSAPTMSGDGRFVLFLTANGGNGWVNLYLRDLQAGTTELISATPSGRPGAGNSGYATMSVDARYVAFQSSAPDLVANDTNDVTDIFVRDRQAQQTILVSAAADGTLANGLSENPTITANGQFVVFESAANNFGPTDTDFARDIYVRDMQSGQITLVSTGLAAIESVACFDPSISDDGNRVAFVCAGHVYLRDIASATTVQISTTTPATPSNRDPFISGDGAHIIFIASDIAGLKRYDVGAGSSYLQRNSGLNGYRATPDGRYAFDGTNRIDFASQTATRTLVDATGANANVFVSSPSISDDGRRVFFLSNATNLVDGVTDGQYRWFVRDLVANTNGTFGAAAPAASGLRLDFMNASSDGSRVAFDANSLGSLGDLNLGIDVFTADLAGGIGLASARTNVAQPTAAGRSFLNGVSADGTSILFSSDAANIVSGDTNGLSDLFVFNVAAGTNRMVLRDAANGSFSRALISPNSRYVAFSSGATNLAASDSDGVEDFFITQLETGETRLITTAFGSSLRAFSDGGRYLLYERSVSPIGLFLYDWENATSSLIPGTATANTVNGSSAMSFDGAWIAFRNTLSSASGGGIYLYDASGAVAARIAPFSAASPTLLAFAPQSHWVVYGSNNVLFAQEASSTNAILLQTNVTAVAASAQANVVATVAPGTTSATQIYLIERSSGKITLVSQSAGIEGNASSDSPQITLDGSRILFRSKASNLVENDTNNIADYFIYESANSTIRRMRAQSQDSPQRVTLSPNGSFAAFQSIFDGIVAGDDNRSSDVFLETIAPALTDITAHIDRAAGQVTLSWNTVAGAKYRIESSPTLIQPQWTAFTSDRVATGDHDQISFNSTGQELYLRILKLP